MQQVNVEQQRTNEKQNQVIYSEKNRWNAKIGSLFLIVDLYLFWVMSSVREYFETRFLVAKFRYWIFSKDTWVKVWFLAYDGLGNLDSWIFFFHSWAHWLKSAFIALYYTWCYIICAVDRNWKQQGQEPWHEIFKTQAKINFFLLS